MSMGQSRSLNTHFNGLELKNFCIIIHNCPEVAITWVDVTQPGDQKSLQQYLLLFSYYLLLLKSSKPQENTGVQKEPQMLIRMQKNTNSPKMNHNCT